jgi:ABC-type sugar transport system substrate-binding protein
VRIRNALQSQTPDNEDTEGLRSASSHVAGSTGSTITRRDFMGAAAITGAAVGLSAASHRPLWRGLPFSANPNRKKIGFSQPDTSASIWQPLMLGAKQECNKYGYTLLESHANSELSLQVAEIEDWIAEGVGAIVVLPLDDQTIEPLVKKAHAAGVKFLTYTESVMPGVDGWIIWDNMQGGQLLGNYAAQWVHTNLGGKAQVATMTFIENLNGRQRIDDAVNALLKAAPGCKVVASHDGVLSPETFTAFQPMIEAHPDINVVICIADEGCDGVLKAFTDTAHPTKERLTDMFICGYDGSVPVLHDILSGSPIRAAAALPAVPIGQASMRIAISAIEGKPGTTSEFPYVLCDASNPGVVKQAIAEQT